MKCHAKAIWIIISIFGNKGSIMSQVIHLSFKILLDAFPPQWLEWFGFMGYYIHLNLTHQRRIWAISDLKGAKHLSRLLPPAGFGRTIGGGPACCRLLPPASFPQVLLDLRHNDKD